MSGLADISPVQPPTSGKIPLRYPTVNIHYTSVSDPDSGGLLDPGAFWIKGPFGSRGLLDPGA